MSSTPTGSAAELLLAGVVVRAHGLHGEIVVDVHTDSPDTRFAVGAVLAAQRPGAPEGELTIASVRPHSGKLLVRFVETPDRTAAEALRGTRLLVAAASLPPPDDPDEFHVHQLQGLRAELVDGGVVGTVADVIHGPGGELLVLRRPEAPDALVPFVRAIVPTVDLAGGRVVLTPPEGLLD